MYLTLSSKQCNETQIQDGVHLGDRMDDQRVKRLGYYYYLTVSAHDEK